MRIPGRSLPLAVALAALAVLARPVLLRAQAVPRAPEDWLRPRCPTPSGPIIPDLPVWSATGGDRAGPSAPSGQVRLLRMPTTFLDTPVGLGDSDLDPGDAADPDAPVAGFLATPEMARLQFAAGQDNPYLDFRRPGTPGGVGYYRVHTQWQMIDAGKTGCTLACQATRPAGVQAQGLREGPTTLSPALTLFHDLGEGVAVHGYVGTDVRLDGRGDGGGQGLQYGLALQQPLGPAAADPNRGLFLFVEALGRYRDPTLGPVAPLHAWEVLPGVHYRMSRSWWFSSGVLVPVGPVRSGSGLWHMTSSWQF